MASTTTAKKEIIDFLWEWAEAKGDWGKLLIDNVVKTKQKRSSIHRHEVFDYFIDSLCSVKKMSAFKVNLFV